MASILPVKGRWRALVRRKGFPTQCQTFDTESQAKRWARQVEADIDAGITPQRVDAGGVTVAEFIRTYRELRSRSRPISALSRSTWANTSPCACRWTTWWAMPA